MTYEIRYAKEVNVTQLHDEVEAAALAELAPTPGEPFPTATYALLVDGDVDHNGYARGVLFLVPDPVVQTALDAIVAAHTPAPVHARRDAAARVLELLAATDKWAARAVEEGAPMAAPRVLYRQQLRVALAAIARSADPNTVALPAAPPEP